MTSCHGPLSGVSWAWAPGQEPGWEKIQMPTVLDYENCQGSLICSTLPDFLSGDMVPLAPQESMYSASNTLLALTFASSEPNF